MPGFAAQEVKRYYEDNTARFLRFGQGVDGTIRRAVWGPGVARRADAMAYVDDLVLERLQVLSKTLERPAKILDLGCGVGASLCRLRERHDLVGTGITISPGQVTLARERIRARGFTGSLSILEGDFCELPADLVGFDLAFAIESFVHAPDATQFFSSASRALRPGGVLILCDDFAARDPNAYSPRERRWLERYREGWRANTLLGPNELERVARDAGFVLETTRDLSAFVELGRPRDYAIAVLARGFGWLPWSGSYWSMLKGGDALQYCLRRGWLSYRFCTWRKQESKGPTPE